MRIFCFVRNNVYISSLIINNQTHFKMKKVKLNRSDTLIGSPPQKNNL